MITITEVSKKHLEDVLKIQLDFHCHEDPEFGTKTVSESFLSRETIIKSLNSVERSSHMWTFIDKSNDKVVGYFWATKDKEKKNVRISRFETLNNKGCFPLIESKFANDFSLKEILVEVPETDLQLQLLLKANGYVASIEKTDDNTIYLFKKVVVR